MQVETGKQLFLDNCGYTITKKETIRKYNPASSAWAFEHSHNILKKQQCCLSRTEAIGKIVENTLLFRTTKRRIGCNHINTLYISDLTNIYRQSIAFAQIRRLNTVEPHVHHT